MNKSVSLWMIIGVAMLPLLFASLSYFGGLWQPQGRVNNGDLIVTSTGHPNLAAGEALLANGRWQLVLLTPECVAQCQNWMHQLQQIKTALGRDADRLEASKRRLISGEQESILLLDPLGNPVLSYGVHQPPKGILKDLKRLFKVSKIG